MANISVLSRSDYKIMKILWEKGDLTASQIAEAFEKSEGWHRNTTYTVIQKCIKKGAVQRVEPNFLCHSLITKDEVLQYKAQELVDTMYDGNRKIFVKTMVQTKPLEEETYRLIQEFYGEELEEWLSNAKWKQ